MTRRKDKKQKANEALLGSPGDVNSPDLHGWTPLMWASSRGSLNLVKALLAAGAEVGKADDEGFSPLMCASGGGHTDIIKLLLQYSAMVDGVDDYGRTAFCWTVTKGDFHDAAMALIAAGANVSHMDKGGFTPLMRAALSKHPRCFHLLLTHGADPKPRHPEHAATALEMARKSGDPRLVELGKDQTHQAPWMRPRERVLHSGPKPRRRPGPCLADSPLWQ